MRVLNDFTCNECGTKDEYFLDNNITIVECQDCGGVAKKAIGTPKLKLPFNDPAGFPTEHAKWAKRRERKIAEEKKTSYFEA